MVFANIALKLLNNYKKLLKKHLPIKEVKQKLMAMGLKRTVLKRDHEVILYRKAQAVIADWNTWASRNKDATPLTYSGLEEFFEHFTRTISCYKIENNKVVHVQQNASASLVKAIQLISLPSYKLTEKFCNELQDCIKKINTYGSKEQQKLLVQALKSYNDQYKKPTIVKITAELCHAE